MRHKIIPIIIATLILVPAISSADAEGADYDKGKACYRELLRAGKGADEGRWSRCIAFFDVYYEKNRDGARASAALFSAARLKQEHYGLRGDRHDLEASIKDFNELIKRFPASPLADDALYRIGCMREDAMGQTERARKAFSHIVENYADGDMAVHAKARLKKLGPKPATAEVAGTARTAETEAVASAKTPASAPPAVLAKEDRDSEPGEDFAAKSDEAIEETEVEADSAAGAEGARQDGVADAFNRATLVNVDVSDVSGGTSVELALDRDVEHSVKFTGVGPRTGSPPELDVILLHTKASKGLLRERVLESTYVDSYKVKHLILSSGIKVSFKLRPDAGYDVKRTPRGISVKFGPQNIASRAIEPADATAAGAPKAIDVSDFRIVIDPGHGGEEEGAIGPNGVMEKDVTLSVARRLAKDLRGKLGAKVYLTRTKDETLTLDQRSAFAVEKKAHLFISIHANASRDRSASGVETYYLNNATDEAAERLAKRENEFAGKKLTEVEHIISTMLQNYDAAESMVLAKEVQGRLAKKVNRKYGGVKDRGVRSALFYVLVGAKCPAILVETAFISNPKEEKLLGDDGFQKNVADAITEGVKGYLKVRDKALVSL